MSFVFHHNAVHSAKQLLPAFEQNIREQKQKQGSELSDVWGAAVIGNLTWLIQFVEKLW